MLPQYGILLIIVAAFVVWVRSTRGRAACALVAKVRVILVVPLVLWGLVWLYGTAHLGPLDRVFFRMRGLSLSVSFLLLIALHAAASALVVAALGRAAGWAGASAKRLLPGIFLGQSVLWIVMFGAARLIDAVRSDSNATALIVAMAVLLVALNLVLARLVARLLANGGRIRDSVAGLWRADRAREAPLLPSVVVRLLVSGAIVLIWISGHVVETREGTTRTRTTRSSNSFKVDTQTVATVTCDNPWPYALAKGTGKELSETVQRFVALVTAFASVLFMAAFASARKPPV